MNPVILWWGRFDPNYSRNRILRNLLSKNGITIRDFRPRSSLFGSVEAALFDPGPADCIWVPCFRHRDLRSARRYADRKRLKLVFDPLISSWDKVVFERGKYPAGHRTAKRLLNWERSLYRSADIVVADTEAHRRFYRDLLGSPADTTYVIPVGAEEPLFSFQPPHPLSRPAEILFFGSFISLQGVEVIVDAARLVPQARWTLLGNGPLRSDCELRGKGLVNLQFEDWIDYESLPERIGKADIVLGIFGDSEKAGRVIPNKVFQALACGRPVVTRHATAYPAGLVDDRAGLRFVPPADAMALACCIEGLLCEAGSFVECQHQARKIYDEHFSEPHIDARLKVVLAALGLLPSPSSS